MAGDWRRALDLLDHDRAAVREEAQRHAVQGLEIRRARVAEMPIGPYLQWELHALKLLADEGGGLSVLTADQVSALETRAPLPEVNVVGDRVLCHIQYEDDGTPCGARRITDLAVIGAAASEIEALYGRGEPLLSFFDRARTAREQARHNALALSHEGDLDRALGQAAGDTALRRSSVRPSRRGLSRRMVLAPTRIRWHGRAGISLRKHKDEIVRMVLYPGTLGRSSISAALALTSDHVL